MKERITYEFNKRLVSWLVAVLSPVNRKGSDQGLLKKKKKKEKKKKKVKQTNEQKRVGESCVSSN